MEIESTNTYIGSHNLEEIEEEIKEEFVQPHQTRIEFEEQGRLVYVPYNREVSTPNHRRLQSEANLINLHSFLTDNEAGIRYALSRNILIPPRCCNQLTILVHFDRFIDSFGFRCGIKKCRKRFTYRTSPSYCVSSEEKILVST